MAIYELTPPGDLRTPILVVSFEGWVNAGQAGTATTDHIAGDGEVVARFDPDALFDYRVNRPTVDFVEGVLRRVEFPAVTMRHAALEERDALVLSGTEPNWRWREFAAAVADLAASLGVVEQISVGGIPSAVPHTRPTTVLSTASRADLIRNTERLPPGLLRVPGAAVTIVEHAVAAKNIPTVGFWAQVPHYLATIYQPAVIALVEEVARHAGVTIPLGSLLDESAEQLRRMDDIISGNAEAEAMVRRMETLVDAQDRVPSGEDLAAEIERYLRDTGDDDGPAFGPG